MGAAVHLDLEITVNAAGQMKGTVARQAPNVSAPFSGVLELLKVLEDVVEGEQSPVGEEEGR